MYLKNWNQLTSLVFSTVTRPASLFALKSSRNKYTCTHRFCQSSIFMRDLLAQFNLQLCSHTCHQKCGASSPEHRHTPYTFVWHPHGDFPFWGHPLSRGPWTLFWDPGSRSHRDHFSKALISARVHDPTDDAKGVQMETYSFGLWHFVNSLMHFRLHQHQVAFYALLHVSLCFLARYLLWYQPKMFSYFPAAIVSKSSETG